MACEAERPSGPPPPAVFELARVLARAAVARDMALHGGAPVTSDTADGITPHDGA